MLNALHLVLLAKLHIQYAKPVNLDITTLIRLVVLHVQVDFMKTQTHEIVQVVCQHVWIVLQKLNAMNVILNSLINTSINMFVMKNVQLRLL